MIVTQGHTMKEAIVSEPVNRFIKTIPKPVNGALLHIVSKLLKM